MTIRAYAAGRLPYATGKWLILATLSCPLHGDFDSAADAYRVRDYLRALEEFQPLAEQGDP
ncbi:MAG: hypothetical protein IIA75_02215, partial [Proteobacteria bacterium]|nr:hypothetical protein [Pseudomonadota bacterium]